MTQTVLIAEDDELKRMTLEEQLEQAGFHVRGAGDGREAKRLLDRETIDAVVTDVRMPGVDGLALLEYSKQLEASRPVLVMTGHAAVEDAVRAMQAGAMDYMVKPVSGEEILLRLERAMALRRMQSENLLLKDEVRRLGGFSEPVIASPLMRNVFDKLDLAAQTDATVLLTGQTGTGKEICARRIHERSTRSEDPFVVVSCAALAPGVVESELFGHEKGAFTGATARREGRLEMADGGTLFLDDVDDVPLEVQAKLLRVLQDGTFERVGGSRQLKVAVRFVAATKRSLQDLVEDGKFRDDLMYRLGVVQVEIPNLAQRPEEIPVLADHFMQRNLVRMGRPPKRFTGEAIETLRAYDWPGNVRQLEHVVESIVALHRGDVVDVADLPDRIRQPGRRNPLFTLSPNGADEINLEHTLASFESQLLEWALKQSDNNQGRAAQRLGIPRSTLQYRMQRVKQILEQ